MGKTSDNPKTTPGILSPLGFSAATATFAALFLFANRVVRLFCSTRPDLDCPTYWPISIIIPRAPPDLYYPPPSHFATAIAVLGVLVLSLFALKMLRYNIILVACVGVVLILGSNLIQGTNFGFIRPIRGPNEYYTDAQRIEDPMQFVSTFVERQPEYGIHSRTHPPGAVLTIYTLSVILGDPVKVSVAIAVLSAVLTVLMFHRLISLQYDKEFSGYTSFLLLLLPSVQIYYAASIDAIIASMLLGALAIFVTSRSRASLILVFSFVSMASFMSFGFLFIIPVIVGYEWFTTGKFKRSGILIIGLVVLYFVIYAATGYNHAVSFRIASTLENPQGYRLLSEPVRFLLTRMECVAEIVLFFGPFLTPLAYLGLVRPNSKDRLIRVAVLGIASLGLMLLAGVFRTGETARAAIFIYPYLMLPVAQALADRKPRRTQEITLAILVFTQAVIMQLVGSYFW